MFVVRLHSELLKPYYALVFLTTVFNMEVLFMFFFNYIAYMSYRF